MEASLNVCNLFGETFNVEKTISECNIYTTEFTWCSGWHM